MHNEFTAILEAPTQDDRYWIAYCPEVPSANGQGETEQDCLESLREAISLLLDLRREQGLKGVPDDAKRMVVEVE